jgi:DNA invertase Pin-like site-specific DNA recombinase
MSDAGIEPAQRQGGEPGCVAPLKAQLRCAIYTRKSTDENLDNDFNSLDAQREAAENYIRSQQQEGWIALPDRYDDPAFSGATLERPALQRLLCDIEARKVDAVVVYKIDRLTRSLLDFAKLIEQFEGRNVSLVSVTQQFNTTTSMGRLTLNTLLSFSQYEREVIAERIRDKVAAAKRRGKYMGGTPPLGYDVDRAAKRLVVNEREAELVRQVFRRFLELRSTLAVARELNAAGTQSKSWVTQKGIKRGGGCWTVNNVWRLLNNVTYIGMVSHRGEVFPGEQEAIVQKAVWEKARAILDENRRLGTDVRKRTPALLKGLVRCGHHGGAMGITFSKKDGRLYRYYRCVTAGKGGAGTCPLSSVSAGELEKVVVEQLREVLHRGYGGAPGALVSLDAVWEKLFSDRQEQLVRRLVERVEVSTEQVKVWVAVKGLEALAREIAASGQPGEQ